MAAPTQRARRQGTRGVASKDTRSRRQGTHAAGRKRDTRAVAGNRVRQARHTRVAGCTRTVAGVRTQGCRAAGLQGGVRMRSYLAPSSVSGGAAPATIAAGAPAG